MKQSNIVLLVLFLILLSGLLVTDYLLAVQYKKINLNDPYKNFELIPVKPFRALKISGGNGYAVRIFQGESYTLRLMNSRKSFFHMKRHLDTLVIEFNVSNQNYQQPETSVTGLIISVPKMDFLHLSGTNNELGPFRQDSLYLQQDKNTLTRITSLEVEMLRMEGTGTSRYDFKSGNAIKSFSLTMKNSTVVNFHDLNFETLHPVLQDSAVIILNKQSLSHLNGSTFF